MVLAAVALGTCARCHLTVGVAFADHAGVLAEQRRTLEAVFAKLGLDPKQILASEEEDRLVYKLRRGSADVAVSIGHVAGKSYVRVAAPVIVPPADAERRAKLFEHALSLNARGLQNAAFGLLEGTLIVVSERPSAGLDEAEFEQMLTHLSAVADTFDDRFVKDFGGELASKR